MKKIKIVLLILIVSTILFPTSLVYADTGAKPSVTIQLENMNTTDYIIDLLVNDTYYSQEDILDSYSQYKGTPIHNYNEDGWLACKLRNWLLQGNIEGNEEYTHRFSYFGVPEKFKIIIQFNDGTIKTSNIIIRNTLDCEITLDVNTMKVNKIYHPDNYKILACILVTLFVEILIAIIMKVKHLKYIALINILTQLLLQFLTSLNFTTYIVSLIVSELLVILIEYIAYNYHFKDIDYKKIIAYTLLANITTIALTFTRIDYIVQKVFISLEIF